MDQSDMPMCGEHPRVPAEVLCIKHRQFVCMKCAVDDRKHSGKKCDVKAIKTMTSENELNLVSLLTIKLGVAEKKTHLERHISNTNSKKDVLKIEIQNYHKKVTEQLQKKLDMALTSLDEKADGIQTKNKDTLEQIDNLIAKFETEIDRLTNKKVKEEETSVSDLKKSAKNIPDKQLSISFAFHPEKKIQDAVVLSPTFLGEVSFVEDDEEYDTPLDEESAYLEPSSIQSKRDDAKDDTGQNYEELQDTRGGGYVPISVTEKTKNKKKIGGRTGQPLPKAPEEPNTYVNTSLVKETVAKSNAKQDKKNTEIKLNIQPSKRGDLKLDIKSKHTSDAGRKSTGSPELNVYENQDTLGKGKTSTPSPTKVVAAKTAGGTPKSSDPPKRSSSIVEKYFPGVTSGETVQKTTSSNITDVKNKSVSISSRKSVKRRLTKLTLLRSGRIVFLDELNSSIIMVRSDGHVVCESEGENFMDLVGSEKGQVAVLGRSKKLQITIYMAFGQKLEVQTTVPIDVDLGAITGFDYDEDSREYAIHGTGRVLMSESGKLKALKSFAKCLSAKEDSKDLKTSYDFKHDCVFILNSSTKTLRRFDFKNEKLTWEIKTENSQYVPYEIFRGDKMIYVSYHDCIKTVTKGNGSAGKPVKTKGILDEVMGLFIDESGGLAVVSSASDTLEGSNKFAVVAV